MEKTVFGSDEWVENLYLLAKQDRELSEAIKNFEGPLVLHIKPNPDRIPEGVAFWVDAADGEIRDIEKLTSPDEKDSRFVLSASYDVWRSITSGEQEILKAILLGRVSIKGNKAVLLRQVKTAKRIAEILHEIPTEYAY